MDKKFLLTTLILGSLIGLTTTGCFHKPEDALTTDDQVKIEKTDEAQPACEIQSEDEPQMEEQVTEEEKETLE